MRHQDLTINHILESWVYANAAARTTASGFVSGDIGRIAYQQDNGSYWRLTATTPTWAAITLPVLTTVSAFGTSTPGAITSSTGKMVGFAIPMTPVRSGKIVANISGPMNCSTAASVNCGLRIGTGAAPVNGAATIGTAFAGGVIVTSTAGYWFSISCTGLFPGVVGTTYWIDLSVASGTGTLTFSNFAFTAMELP
jgi:hypothetical protein